MSWKSAVFGVITLVLFGYGGVALAQSGGIYVESHISGETCAKTAGARMSQVYIYDTEGARVLGDQRGGSFLPGRVIRLDPGQYYVSVGTRESHTNLYNYTVEEGKVTVVPTGWVSIATVPKEDQPTQGCAPWSATLTAYLDKGESEHQDSVVSNRDKKPDAYGIIQLHPGTYEIGFNHFMIPVEVKRGKDYRLPTGSFGPALNGETFLLRSHQDDPNKVGALICQDGEIHVPAGDYVVRQTVFRNDMTESEDVFERITIEATGAHGYTDLKDEHVKNAREPGPEEGKRLAYDVARKLPKWGERRSSNKFDLGDGF